MWKCNDGGNSSTWKYDTCELIPKPHDVDLITCKWVYKLKKKVDGRIDRQKARLIAMGSLSNMVETMMRLLVRLQRW